MTDHSVEPRNRTGEVRPADPFHSLDNLKNHFASVAFCRNSGVYNVQNGAVIELSFVVVVVCSFQPFSSLIQVLRV